MPEECDNEQQWRFLAYGIKPETNESEIVLNQNWHSLSYAPQKKLWADVVKETIHPQDTTLNPSKKPAFINP